MSGYEIFGRLVVALVVWVALQAILSKLNPTVRFFLFAGLIGLIAIL